jgi:sugar (pentulose or hexulose) kinase
MKNTTAILALDLGTTAFKCGVVRAADGRLAAPPLARGYVLNTAGGGVTCAPAVYTALAEELLSAAAAEARRLGLTVTGIGLSSQAQTWLPLDAAGHPLADAVVWTDARATREAAEIAETMPDFAAHSGFAAPSPMQFLPKVRQWVRAEPALAAKTDKYLLLNEFIICHLTGHAYGDTNLQGMCGFLDLRTAAVSPAALALAGITAAQLADSAPAAAHARPLRADMATRLGLPAVPVYSCGNDQSCGAVGAGVTGTGAVLCNFGTAMVVYALCPTPYAADGPDLITGISPLRGNYFRLGVESECGNVMERLHDTLCPELSYDAMIHEAEAWQAAGGTPPGFRPVTGGGAAFAGPGAESAPRAAKIAAALAYFTDRFTTLLAGVTRGTPPQRLFAAGGLSRSQAWLHHLEHAAHTRLNRAPDEHAGLPGIHKIIHNAKGT